MARSLVEQRPAVDRADHSGDATRLLFQHFSNVAAWRHRPGTTGPNPRVGFVLDEVDLVAVCGVRGPEGSFADARCAARRGDR